MPILGKKSAMGDGPARPARATAQTRRAPRRFFGRAFLRSLHRDAGYLVVGLTFVYALSGLAVNHVADRDPSFDNYEWTHQLGGPISGSDSQISQRVLDALKIHDTPRDVYRSTDDTLDITFDKRTLHVTLSQGSVLDQGQEPRFFLRAANYLHLNRGKKAWTYVADTYAVVLLFLAVSGLFMIKGRQGLIGRGLVLVSLGAAVPIAYVLLS
ncbi:MAG TPA: PepSY-associated TM helix domain-containing protein [Polyangiales bacterium]|nr:PepSY-associated TM helix domain-containing protein [Polyangiales bacterium]